MDRQRIIAQIEQELKGMEDQLRLPLDKVTPALVDKLLAGIARQKQLLADLKSGQKP